MNKKTEGLIEYISSFDLLLLSCKSDRTFFLELARFMRTVSREIEFRNIIEIFNKDRTQLASMLAQAESKLDSIIESNLSSIFSHPDFPVDHTVIKKIIEEMDRRKRGIYLTSEPIVEMKYTSLLKCMEALDTEEYVHIVKEFKSKGDKSSKYKIYYEYQEYETVKLDYTLQRTLGITSNMEHLRIKL